MAMKSPGELRQKLVESWNKAGIRSKQLLNAAAWPWELKIGKPSPRSFNTRISTVQSHVEAWRQVKVGKVEWIDASYRNGAESVRVPARWCLRTPSEWVAATQDTGIAEEYEAMGYLVERVPDHFHKLLVIQRGLWKGRDRSEIIQAAIIASQLTPGCARGLPLRLLSGYGVDTKFFERHEVLLRKMLDVLFEGEASEQTLCGFLDAYDESNHWVLVMPLEAGLLQYQRLKLTTSELGRVELPGERLLIVENEKCFHQLIDLPGTIAVLGCGLDLAWLGSEAHRNKATGYWGDMDSWGMQMLARARAKHGGITSLLMNEAIFDKYRGESAVPEPVRAQEAPPAGLTDSESALFRRLVESAKGRLEQEFIPHPEVHQALIRWVEDTRTFQSSRDA